MSDRIVAQSLYGGVLLRLAESQPPEMKRPRLTQRQETIIRLIAEGYSSAEIAEQLGIKERTVKSHAYEILRKLQARNRAHAVMRAVRLGSIPL